MPERLFLEHFFFFHTITIFTNESRKEFYNVFQFSFHSRSVLHCNRMATDIDNSSCSSSLVDSGFESSPPKPPPRKKRSKSTWSLAVNDQEANEIVEKKSTTKAFSEFLKTFAPSAKEKLKQSFWTLVTLLGEK